MGNYRIIIGYELVLIYRVRGPCPVGTRWVNSKIFLKNHAGGVEKKLFFGTKKTMEGVEKKLLFENHGGGVDKNFNK